MTSSHDLSGIRLIAKELEEDGYCVTLQPDPSLLPFSIQNYRPDLLATGEGGRESLIIDVKTRGERRSIEQYKKIADEIGKHKGWRFMLSTIDDPEQIENTEIKPELSQNVLIRALNKLESLIESDSYELAVPYLWTIFISGMRTTGRQKGLPIDATTDRSVINTMYTMGEISASEFEEAKLFLQIRNKLIHTFEAQLSKEQVLRLASFTKQKLQDWNMLLAPQPEMNEG